jgi:RNA polymerase sigma-70 factor (ECF subfamily)
VSAENLQMIQTKQPAEDDFDKLALQYAEQLYRLAFARVGNAADAEDIVQETYLKAFKNFPTFRHETSVKNWLSKILVNSIRDHFRKSGRAVETVKFDDSAELDERVSEPGADELLCHCEIHPELMKALSSLPEQLLAPLLLREIDDASYEEIAQILDVPKGTVMSRLFRARSLLRKKLTGARDAQEGLTRAKPKL